MLDFGAIIAPATPDAFVATYWGKRGVHLPGGRRTFAPIFDWQALTALLNSGGLTFSSTVVSREERPVPAGEFTGADGAIDPAAVLRLLRDGASVSIRGADARWPPLRVLADALYDALFEQIHTNVYCTPAKTQGFRRHYDLHEVFVLQVEGTKHWRVFAPTIEAPVDSWRDADAPGAGARPYLDVTLHPGDVLYVPRGHWHDATAGATRSLHITAGVSCRRGDTLLDWLAPQLRALPAWRRNVPAMGPPAIDGRLPLTPDISAWAAELRDAIAETLAQPDVLERFLTLTCSRPPPALGEHHRATARCRCRWRRWSSAARPGSGM
jgi:ribosomal protein L16 Arg81 hydroxylase